MKYKIKNVKLTPWRALVDGWYTGKLREHLTKEPIMIMPEKMRVKQAA